MFSRTVLILSPPSTCANTRGMATLKDIRNRLKSVKNIQKITKSMQMVSAAKFAKAERELRPARPYGHGAQAFFEKADVANDETKPQHLVVAVSSDRGLCGAIHSSIAKTIKLKIADRGQGVDTKIVAVGDKARLLMQKGYASNILMHFTEIGKKPPVFQDAAIVSKAILDSGYEYDFGELYFNTFRSVVSYRTTAVPLHSLNNVSKAENIGVYDSLDEEVLRCYNEFAMTSLIYFAMKENATSEQSSRMTSMDSATKNAGEMIDKLTLAFNRTRQAVITRELIEIISGAAAL